MNKKEKIDMVKNIDLKEYIESQGYTVVRTGQSSYKSIICPFCNGGDHFSIDDRVNKYKSFSPNCTCGESNSRGSILDFVMEYRGVDMDAAIEELVNYSGIDSGVRVKMKERQKVDNNEIPNFNYDFTDLVDNTFKNNNSSNEYFLKRGLTVETIKKYKLIYNPKGLNDFFKDYPEFHSKLGFVFQYFIPIYHKDKVVSFVIRANDEVLENTNMKYKKRNPDFKLDKTHNLKGLPMIPWNIDILSDTSKMKNKDDKKIYICEGIFDAFSLEEYNKNAISCNSANNYAKLIPFIKENNDNLKDYTFVLCGDDDAAGENFNSKLEALLSELNLKVEKVNIQEPYHDINEMFVRNKDVFIYAIDNTLFVNKDSDNVNEDVVKNKEEFARKSQDYLSSGFSKEDVTEIKTEIIVNDLLANGIKIEGEDFRENLKREALPLQERVLYSKANRKNDECLFKTGFKELDKILKYGTRKIIGLGAIPGAGKTTLCINIAVNLAKQKKHSIFYSLELDETFVMSKILSALSATEEFSTCKLDAQDIYYFIQDALPTLSPKEEDNLLVLAEYYENEIRPYLHIDDFIDRVNFKIADRTIEAMFEHTKNYIINTKIIPVIFVDYIQCLETANVKLINDKQRIDFISSKMIEMKKILGVTLFLISSLNRDSYLEQISETSFKESGAIEYAADMLCGIQWRNMKQMIDDTSSKGELKAKIDELKCSKKLFKKLELITVKNRTGASGNKVNLDFYGAYNLFTDAGVTPNDFNKNNNDIAIDVIDNDGSSDLTFLS